MAFPLRRGFTLVELLVSIGIISLLSMLLLPALQNAMQKARDVKCANNLKQTGISTLLYVDDNHGRLPSNWLTSVHLYASATSQDPLRIGGYDGLGKLYSQSYLSDAHLLACGSEDMPKKRYASAGYGGALNFAKGNFDGNGNSATDLMFRCGRKKGSSNLTSVSLSLSRVDSSEGLIMCGARSLVSEREKNVNWFDLHQNKGFSFLFIDLHGQYYSYERCMPPELWTTYDPSSPEATFRNAVQNLK
ncbi:MAG: prepilin-type N-terminal cleavage/methylation domain-containing protein [Planctomycetes bacterium]|nr:prepilin-type N-terminal cleavage/methylation domain-containing protein [Planctomycetota bacterium]